MVLTAFSLRQMLADANQPVAPRDEHGARYRGNCLSAKKRQAEKLFREALHAIRRNKS